MRNVVLVIAVFCSVLLTALEARGQCACTPESLNITAREEFDLAYSVFVGRVVAIKQSSRDKNDHYVETVTFQVSRVWKHDVNSNLTITNTISGCVNGFKENEEWLVYTYRNLDGTLGTHCCCTRTTLLTRAGDDVKTFADDPPAKILRPPTSKP